MILVFRIVKSEDRGDTVKLTLAEDGIEDPKVNAIVLESDDLPGYKSGHYNYAFTEKDGPRPTVMVNGVEMWLNLLQTRESYEMVRNLAQAATTAWMMTSGSKKGNPNIGNFTFCRVENSDIIAVVAWK